MDEKRHTSQNLMKSRRKEEKHVLKSQQALAKALRVYHLSSQEISDITGLAIQEVEQL
jgi:hypothetical protein